MAARRTLGTWTQRAAVATADLLLAPIGWLPARRRPVRRILLLRLERIGDLLMALDAVADVRAAWPDATVDLAVGSWNEPLARLIPGISTVHTLDVPWLSRGERPTSWAAILRLSRGWRACRYDMVVNFEPDIRSNLLAWLSGAPVRVGFSSGGGRPFLTRTSEFDTSRHVAENARALARHAADETAAGAAPAGLRPRLDVPDSVELDDRFAGRPRPFIGLHVSGGRASKQWHLSRFAEVAQRLVRQTGGTIVLTGASGDRAMARDVAASLREADVLMLVGDLDLPGTAAALARLDVLITGDTGPMHLAAAVDRPIVALFGPSDPGRYGPRAARERILRVQLPCSPCGQVRRPPARCRGRVPDCMDGITVEAVVDAALALLEGVPGEPRAASAS